MRVRTLALLALATLTWACAPVCTPSASSASEVASPSRDVLPSKNAVGVAVHRLQVADIPALAAAGVKVVRMDMHWELTERRQGVYEFGRYKRLAVELRKVGITPIFILDYSNRLYAPMTRVMRNGKPRDRAAAPATPETRAAYVAWARAAAKAFHDTPPVFEIWNEPDVDHFWAPKANALAYRQLAEETCDAIRNQNPRAAVIGPAAARAPWPSKPRSEFLGQVMSARLLRCLSGVSVHPYGTEEMLEDTPAMWRALHQIATRRIGRRAADRLALVNSEWGLSTVRVADSEERQAAYLAKMLALNQASGVALSIWYDWKDDGPDPRDPQHHFGLLRYDGAPKPAYLAFKTASGMLDGRTPDCSLSDDQRTQLLFKPAGGSGQRLMVAWGGRSRAPPPLALPQGVEVVRVVDHLGQSLTFAPDMSLVSAPLYFELQGPADALARLCRS